MTKLQTAAEIIKNGALETLAAKHGLTVAQVVEAISAGHVRACEQFAQLVNKGIETALEMAATGKIHLV